MEKPTVNFRWIWKNENKEGNAVALAKTPVMDKLMKEYPFVKRKCIWNGCRSSRRTDG